MNKKQKYHIEPPKGLMNDPNGLVHYRGTYYIFYQWNRFDKNHTYKEWGLFRTDDWITWDHHGSAILPDQDYDLQGIYSGSGLEIDGRLHLYYTGNSKVNGIRTSSQCLAVTDNGQTFLKKGPVLPTPAEYTGHFRDSKIFRGQNRQYYMLVGGQKKASGTGAIALCRSHNGLDWEYINELAANDAYQMVECPDLIRFETQDILIYCLQRRDNAADENLGSIAVFRAGVFNEEAGSFSSPAPDDHNQYLDYGFDFYAPQTFADRQGRHILLAWMSNMDGAQEVAYGAGSPRLHCMTMPRELSWQNDTLYQVPLPEMYELTGDALPGYPINETLVYPLAERAFYLLASHLTGEDDICIDILEHECVIVWDAQAGNLSLTRTNWVSGLPEARSCRINHLDCIEIWYDTASIELFINHGEAVMSARISPESECGEVILNGLTKQQVQIKNMKSFSHKGEEKDE